MGKEQAIAYSHKEVLEDYIIISINEPNEQQPQFNQNIHLKEVLYLYFEDISEPKNGYITISDEDAINILHFIDRNRGITNIIIHCLAGVSRSVSIRCALEEVYNNRVIGSFVKEDKIHSSQIINIDDLLKEKDDNIYIFNKLCYEKIKYCSKKFRE